MQMTLLFIQLTSPLQYYYPNKNGKTSQNETESSQKALCYIRSSFCCDVLKTGFYMVSLCQTRLTLVVFYQNKEP